MMEDTAAVGWLYGGDELVEELEEIVESLKEGWGVDVGFLFFFFFVSILGPRRLV